MSLLQVFCEIFSKRIDRNNLTLSFFPLGFFQSTMDPKLEKNGYSCFAKLNANEELWLVFFLLLFLFLLCSFYLSSSIVCLNFHKVGKISYFEYHCLLKTYDTYDNITINMLFIITYLNSWIQKLHPWRNCRNFDSVFLVKLQSICFPHLLVSVQ